MTPLAAWRSFRRSARGQLCAIGAAIVTSAAAGMAAIVLVVVHVVRVERGSKVAP